MIEARLIDDREAYLSGGAFACPDGRQRLEQNGVVDIGA